MALEKIENMTLADLKANKDTLITEAEAAGVKELAARYVQARTDATMRDERMAEQAAMIATLTSGHDAAVEKGSALQAELETANSKISELDQNCQILRNYRETDAADASAKLTSTIEGAETIRKELTAQLAAQTARAERFKAEAVRNRAALATMAKVANDAVARQTIEDLEKVAE